jgi:hypothetical protein
MKPEVNAVLQEVKASLANPQPTMPDFKTMSIMEATKWCMEHGIEKGTDIANLTGKKLNTVHTAQWKLRNPKRVKVLARRAKKAKAKEKELKIMLIKDATKGKTTKPKIENGRYDDGEPTPYTDSVHRTRFNFLDEERQPTHELVAENRRLKILVEHYETLLFKGGK